MEDAKPGLLSHEELAGCLREGCKSKRELGRQRRERERLSKGWL